MVRDGWKGFPGQSGSSQTGHKCHDASEFSCLFWHFCAQTLPDFKVGTRLPLNVKPGLKL